MSPHKKEKKYPKGWPKVSYLIRKLANEQCEHCKRQFKLTKLSCHHIGAPFVGSPGDPRDKHDIRRENLVALCRPCHVEADRERNYS